MFYDNLKIACKNKGTSVTATLKKIGIGTANGTYWKKGSVPASDIVVKLSEFLQVSTDFLLKGTESSSSPRINNDEQELLTYYKELSPMNKGLVKGEAKALSGAIKKVLEEPENTIFIEIYSLPVSAGTGVYLDSCDKTMIEVIEDELTAEANYALRVSGDSMEPDFHDGDIILIRSQPTVELGEIGIFILDGSGYVKEFGGDYLISHNEQYENIKLSEYSEVYCRGLVLGVLDSSRIV